MTSLDEECFAATSTAIIVIFFAKTYLITTSIAISHIERRYKASRI
jgi:hypothetical protein